MSPAFIETVACSWCTKHRPRSRVHPIASGQTICDYCLEWHFHGLEVLGGAVPHGCQACNTPWHELQARTPERQVRMYVVPKDGIYQVMCLACVTPFLPKQQQLYKGTRFGTETLKL